MYIMPNLSGSGGRSSHVSFTTSYWFSRMSPFLQSAPHLKRGADVLAVTYQANTGAGAGSLKRVARNLNIN